MATKISEEQKALKSRFMEIIRTEVWKSSTSMQQYAEKECCYHIVELKNGDIYAYERPRIETSFCFGYGMNGLSTDDDMDGASRMAQRARTDEDYFIEENLKDIKNYIDRLVKAYNGELEAYKYAHYSGQPHGTKLKTYSVVSTWDNPENDPGRWSCLTDVEQLTQYEILTLIQGWYKVAEMFTKRLNTYLKRYGLSKLNTWTYLRD